MSEVIKKVDEKSNGTAVDDKDIVKNNCNNNNDYNYAVKDRKQSQEKVIDGHIHYDTSIEHLEEGIKAFEYGLELFYQNKFETAIEYMSEKSETCQYHSLSRTYFSTLGALLTLESGEITKAKNNVYQTIHLAQKLRHSSNIFTNISHLFWKENYDKLEDYEVHAELAYAEGNLLMTLLMFFGDQNLMSLIKGAFAIRAANQSFKHCAEILRDRKWTSDYSKKHFESGVYSGLGILNIVLSMLPTRILKILSMIGFSGDRDEARDLFMKSMEIKDGSRYCITTTAYKSFELFIEQLMGVGDQNFELMQEIMDEFQVKYPKACFIVFFSAILKMINGEPEKAIKEFNECIKIQDDWTQIHNICRWNLFVCYSMIEDWKNSVRLAEELLEKCAFSPAISAYRLASTLYLEMKATNKPELKKRVDELMTEIPGMKMRYAGKTIPQEKLCILRAEQYMADGQILVAPIYEFHYIWNALLVTKTNAKIAEKVIANLDAELDEVAKLESEFKLDYRCRLLLLKGVMFRNLDKDSEAVKCFNEIIEKEKTIVRDKYLPPHAALELGLTYMKTSDVQKAKYWLQKTTADYQEFLVESLVQLRVHNGLRLIKKLEKANKA